MSVSSKQLLIVYIRVILDDTVCTYFLGGLLPRTKASATTSMCKTVCAICGRCIWSPKSI